MQNSEIRKWEAGFSNQVGIPLLKTFCILNYVFCILSSYKYRKS
jgi:hypothetical protein